MLKTILNKIKEYETIIIHGHKRPDGDCYGSQFGLKDIIKNSFPKKKVYVVGETSEYVNFVGKVDVIDDKIYENALSIVVDTATRERISDQRYTNGKEVIKIDHHIAIDNYGDHIWVEEDWPSCSQMIAYFYKEFEKELKMSKEGAVAMYTGIVTDTGRFRYRGVNSKTLELAGILLDHGADVEEIDNQLSRESLNVIALKGYVYSNFITTKEGFLYIKLEKGIPEKFNVTFEEASSLVGILGGIEGFPVWALFLETDENIRVRLRSSGPDIDKIANKFRGGGHQKASGATLFSWSEIDEFIKETDKVVKEYKKGL